MSVLLARLTARGRREVERAVGRALGDSVGDDRLVTEPPTNGGDEERLRGIPVIGGTTGAIRGTVPGRGRHLDEWEGRPS
ncbi:hypothetical protein [Miltoncostaea oceani]|uniref:hypothetical protein n=1 Tax=Miltoncostaea oceani TaxID=2843216 RepID=UPI001C3CA040|nr:hypothetical protein [Miltoncostaea oceani]